MLAQELAPVRDDAPLTIAGVALRSRLFIGTAGYPNQQVMLDAIEASGAEIVTAAIRRISLEGYAESLVDLLGDGRYRLLPNTSGCATVRDAVLTAQLAREALETDWVKLELIGDRETLYPDVEQLVQAAEELVRDGFTVLPYCNDDPVTCRKLAEIGCAAVMPLGSPIGSGMGICNPYNIELICAHSPQAKGRVERRHAVFQDRLVKELRLRNISEIRRRSLRRGRSFRTVSASAKSATR